MRMTVILIVIDALRTVPAAGKKIEGTENRWKNRDHSDRRIAEIGWNTEESSEEVRRQAVT